MTKTDRTTHLTPTHPLQSEAWGDFRQAMGIDVVRLNGHIITFHRVPNTPWTIGYFPKGPAPTKKLLDDLKKLGVEKNAIFIQLEPNVIADHHHALRETDTLIRSHHPLFTKYTFILDLTKSENDLLSTMNQKARYNIRVAQKHDVTVKKDDSQEAFEAYLALAQETTTRQGFYAHNAAYHRTMWKILHAAGIAHLFTATHQHATLAAWIIFAWGDTIYYPYGASSRLHREVMAPNLLLWEIAKWGKTHGYKKFDLWGAMGPDPDPKDPWYGFHRFKEGYRPDLVEFVGSYDLIIKPFLYRLYIIADIIRWKLLHLKK